MNSFYKISAGDEDSLHSMAPLTARLRVNNAVQTLFCGSPMFPQGIKFPSLQIVLKKTKDSI